MRSTHHGFRGSLLWDWGRPLSRAVSPLLSRSDAWLTPRTRSSTEAENSSGFDAVRGTVYRVDLNPAHRILAGSHRTTMEPRTRQLGLPA